MRLIQGFVVDNRKLLAVCIKHNPINLWNKTTLQDGFSLYNASLGNAMTKAAGEESIIENEAGRLQWLLQDLNTRKTQVTTCTRTPKWLMHLLALIEVPQELLEVSSQNQSNSQALAKASPLASTPPSSAKRPLIRVLTKTDSTCSEMSIASTASYNEHPSEEERFPNQACA